MGPTLEPISAARQAFRHYLRTGQRVAESAFSPKPSRLEVKFNPYHDPLNGQFTFAPGGPRSLNRILVSDRRRSPSRSELITDPATGPESGSTPTLTNGVYRPGESPALFRRAQYRPPVGRGDNSGRFQDPITLQQAFPGLRDAPGGSIIALADNILDLTGPADRLSAAVTQEVSASLINEIRAIDPSYNFDSLGAPSTTEGRSRQIDGLRLDKAAALYRTQGRTDQLQVEVTRFLQQRTDAAYTTGLRMSRAGKLDVTLSPEVALGNYIDRSVRESLRNLYRRLNISTARGQKIRVNSREYDTSGTDRTYRRPDARIAEIAFDVTLTRKTQKTQQVMGFFNADFRPISVIIIRPSQLGSGSSYILTRVGA